MTVASKTVSTTKAQWLNYSSQWGLSISTGFRIKEPIARSFEIFLTAADDHVGCCFKLSADVTKEELISTVTQNWKAGQLSKKFAEYVTDVINEELVS